MLRNPTNVSSLAYPYLYERRASPESPEEAADDIRELLHDPSLNLTFRGNSSTFFGFCDQFRSDDASFWVNPMTGQVINIYSNSAAGKNVSVTLAQAQAIATDYARTHYSGFSSAKGMKLTTAELSDWWPDKRYDFEWQECVDGVKTFNRVEVTVDAETGRVLTYWGLALPVPTVEKPKIDPEQGILIALDQLGTYDKLAVRDALAENKRFNITFLREPSSTGDLNATIYAVNVSRQFAFDDNLTQHQVWYVIIDEERAFKYYGSEAKGDRFFTNVHRWWISVDVGTGEIIYLSSCF